MVEHALLPLVTHHFVFLKRRSLKPCQSSNPHKAIPQTKADEYAHHATQIYHTMRI